MTRASSKRKAGAKKDDGIGTGGRGGEGSRAREGTPSSVPCSGRNRPERADVPTDQPKKKKASDTNNTAGKNVIEVTEVFDGANGGVRIASSADSVGSEGTGTRRTGTADEDEKKTPKTETLVSAAFGSDKPDLVEKDEDSNLADVEPLEGMEIDFRDPDYIWSSGRIVGVKSTPKSKAAKKQVTVQYDGWPADWNEVVTWPSVRVAKLFTYTKRVRCFAEGILSKKNPPKKKSLEDTGRKFVTCHLWPCTVRFRMPHPAHRGRAEELLRLEPNVFVQPYAPETLPQDIACNIENSNGAWLHNGKLRMWKNDNALSMLGTVDPSFDFAYKVGQNDSSTPGKLPSRAMEVGSLLNADYRVFKVGGEAVKGRMYTGECAEPKPTVPKFAPSKKSTSKASSNRKLRSEEAKLKAEVEAKRRRRIQRPPKLPRPLVIYDPSSKLTSEAVRLRETKRWGAAISVGGNDLFLGSFPTQAHAIASSAIALAKNTSDSDDSSAKPSADVGEDSSPAFPRDEMEGRIADLNATRLEDSICALERSNKHGPFSLHDWTMQSIRYQAYLKEKRERLHMSPSDEDVIERSAPDDDSGPKEDAEAETASKRQKLQDAHVDIADKEQQRQEASSMKPKSKRKQSNPRRLDLETRVYDPPR